MADYGVLTANPFAFLDDDAPPPSKKEAKAPVKKEEPKAKPNARPESARNNDRGDRNERSGAKGGKGKGGKGGKRGKGGKGGDRGERGERSERSERPKREFDRHVSGTGRDKGVKKEGHGRGGWGEEELRPRQVEAEVEASEEPTVEVEEETPAEEAKPAEPEEPEDTSVTYDEFLAQQAAKVVDDDVREVRSVLNDDAKFKGKELVKKDDMDDFQLEFGTGEQQLKKTRKGKKTKQKIS